MIKRVFFQKPAALICASFMLAAAFPAVPAGAEGEIASRTGVSVDLRVGVFSDSHVVNNTAKLAKALDTYQTIDPNMKMGMTGDIIYQNEDINADPSAKNLPERYDTFLNLYKEKGFSIDNSVYAMGNHEFVQNATSAEKYDAINAESKALFTQKTGLAPNHVKTWNGYTFIAASPDSYSNNMSAQSESWVLEQIRAAEAASADKPIFYFQHQPLYNTVYGSTSVNPNSEGFLTELAKHPRVIVLTAHCHYAAHDPRSIWQGGYTAVQSSVIDGGYLSWQGCLNEGNVTSESYGLMMEIKGSTVEIYKLDFTKNQYIGQPYVIDVSNPDGWKYTNAYREANKNANLPAFPAGAGVSVSGVTGHGATVTFDSTATKMESAADMMDGFVHSYRVQVVNKTTGTTVQDFRLLGDFWKAPAEQRASRSVALSKLSRNTEYEVKVSPLSPYQAEGAAISTTFATTNEKDESDRALTVTREVNVALNKPIMATDENTSYPVTRLVDGNRGRSDTNSFCVPSSTTASSYIQIDLQKRYQVKRIELYDRLGTNESGGRVNFQFQGSNDENFASYDVLGGIGASDVNNEFPNEGVYTLNLDAQNDYRYIRLQRTAYGYWGYNEIKVFADVEATEISRFRSAKASHQYSSAYGGDKAVDGISGNSGNCWIGQYSVAGYKYLTVDLEKAQHVGLIEMEGRAGVANGLSTSDWTIFGSNVMAEDAVMQTASPEGYTKLYATGSRESDYKAYEDYVFPWQKDGMLRSAVDDSAAYRYITFRHKNTAAHTPEIGEVRAFVLNPMVNSVVKNGNTVTISFSDQMDRNTLTSANVKVYDASAAAQDVALNVADDYTVSFDTTVTGGKVVLSEAITNAYGVELAHDVEFVIENTSTDYSNKTKKTFENYNVAFHKPVEAYAAHDTNLPEYLTDGVTGAGTSNFCTVAGDEKNISKHYLTVDLGRAYSVERVELYGNNSVNGQDGAFHHFKVSGSADGITYETLAEEGDYDQNKWDGLSYRIDLAEDNSYRYIKWEKTDNSYFRLDELKVFANVQALKVTERTNIVTGYSSEPYHTWFANLVDGSTGNFIYNAGQPNVTPYPWATVQLDEAYPVEMIQIYRRGHGTSSYADSRTAQMYVGVYGSNSTTADFDGKTNETVSAEVMSGYGYNKLMETGSQDVFAELYGGAGGAWEQWAFDNADGFVETFRNDDAYRYLTLKRTYGNIGYLQPSEFAAYVLNPTLNKISARGSEITLSFSDEMIESLLAEHISLWDNNGAPVPITQASLSADKHEYTIRAELAEGKIYTVKAGAAIRSVKGVPMQEDAEKAFTAGKILVSNVTVTDANGNAAGSLAANATYTVTAQIRSTTATDTALMLCAAVKNSGTLTAAAANTEKTVKAGDSVTVDFTFTTGDTDGGNLEIFAWERDTLRPLGEKIMAITQ